MIFSRFTFCCREVQQKKRPRKVSFVRIKGLEPPRRKASDPKSDVATNYTISAYGLPERGLPACKDNARRAEYQIYLTFPGPRPLFWKDSTKNAILRSRRAVYPVFCLILPLSSSGPVTRGGVKRQRRKRCGGGKKTARKRYRTKKCRNTPAHASAARKT